MRYIPLLLIFACSASTNSGPELSGGGGGTEASGESSSSGSSESSGSTEPLDVAHTETACGGLDVLFVVDNSGSMADNQAAVAASAPGFIQDLRGIAPGLEKGLHVGVATDGAYWAPGSSPCSQLGALVTYGTEGSCNFPAGQRFLTDQDDLGALACALTPGQGGGPETMVGSAIEALGPWLGSEGQCNEGFHRTGVTWGDDFLPRAGLVLVILTDEDDKTLGDPQDWVDKLAWIRGGSLDDTTLVLLAGGECATEVPDKLLEFTELVPHAATGTVCASDFSPVFLEALPAVAGACGFDYTPVP